MADFYVDSNGKITTKKKKKKSEYSVEEEDIAPLPSSTPTTAERIEAILKERAEKKEKENAKKEEEDIAPLPVASEREHGGRSGSFGEKDRTWFQGGAFSDGYQFGDVSKTLMATGEDVRGNLIQGILGIGEGVVDAGATLVGGVGKLLGADNFADKTKEFVKKDIIDEEELARRILRTSNYVAYEQYGGKKGLEESSLLGDKSDSLVQSGGQLIGQIALGQVHVPWWLTTGLTSFGGESESAFQEGATYGEAVASAAVSAGSEMLTEKLFAGSGLGEKGLINLQPLTRGISNRALKVFLDYGIDIAAEGSEEVVSQFFSTLGQQLSYEKDETWAELLSDEKKMDAYLHQVGESLFGEEAREAYGEAFIGGAVLGGGANVGNVVGSIQSKTDYRTGLNAQEDAVFKHEYENRISEAEKVGKKLTKDEKAKIYDEVMNDLEKGYISTDTIEEVLGGETYKSYQDTVKNEDALVEQEKTLRDEFNTLNRLKTGDRTGEQTDRLEELRSQLSDLTTKIEDNKKNSRRDWLQRKYKSEVEEVARGSRLQESYN